jgi:hypothetical protein
MLKKILSLFEKQPESFKSVSKINTVAVYKSQAAEMLLFNPLAQHLSGGSVATNKTLILTGTLDTSKIGKTLKDALELAETLPRWDESLKDDLIEVGKVRNRSQFVRKFFLVSVTFFDAEGTIKLKMSVKHEY